MMWIDVVESGDWIRQLYDVVPPLEDITCNFMFVDEGGGSIELRTVLPVPVDHSAVRGRGGDGIILVLLFHGVRSFRMRMVGKRMISSAQLERVDGCVVFHGYGEQIDCTIVADSVSIGK